MIDEEKDSGPVIGILCLDIQNKLKDKYGEKYKSYIPASYVKFLEGAGAKVVPIWIGKDRSYYEDIMQKINGVLFPGGAIFFYEQNGYRDAGTHIYNIAIETNNIDDYMPILGICLGYELLLYIDANKGKLATGKPDDDIDPRQDCKGNFHCIPLEFKEDLGRLFSKAPKDILEIFRTEDVTFNYHRYCITEKDLEDYKLLDNWKALSTNKDKKGLEYISTIENRYYPFYGLQFHPEKNAYEPLINYPTCRSTNGIKASQYLANFFVNEARKSKHQFDSIEDQYFYLIYNYPIVFTALQKTDFLQSYMFEENVDYFKENLNEEEN